MKTRRMSMILIALIGIILVGPRQTLACACCADEGAYFKASGKIKDDELKLMKQIHFGNQAFLFSTPAGPEEDAKGIKNPQEDYSLSASLVSNSWRLFFRNGTVSGVLTLTFPLNMESYQVDIHDGKLSGGGGPLLYKEWRFEGRMNGSGIFRTGTVVPLRYSLVFQGRGNACDNAKDFANWRLEVSGRNAGYAFYGNLAQ